MSETLIIGASSAIVRALAKALKHIDQQQLIAVSRHTKQLDQDDYATCFESDYSEASVVEITDRLQQQQSELSQVFICNGLLHNTSIQPEKRIENLDPEQLKQVMTANAIIPILWIKHLKKLVKGHQPCVITVFSARVGSIDDNRLGGWYSYRASASLNMMVKNASIEFARFAKGTRFLIFHPGTTDSPLSRPFQKSVAKDKLFTPDFVANQLIQIVENLERTPGIDYLDWNNQTIPW